MKNEHTPASTTEVGGFSRFDKDAHREVTARDKKALMSIKVIPSNQEWIHEEPLGLSKLSFENAGALLEELDK